MHCKRGIRWASGWRTFVRHEVESSLRPDTSKHIGEGVEEQVGTTGCDWLESSECNSGELFSVTICLQKCDTLLSCASEYLSMIAEYVEVTLEVDTWLWGRVKLRKAGKPKGWMAKMGNGWRYPPSSGHDNRVSVLSVLNGNAQCASESALSCGSIVWLLSLVKRDLVLYFSHQPLGVTENLW